MRRPHVIARAGGLAIVASALSAASLVVGCSEPTGEAAYSQQFEKPEGFGKAAEAQSAPDPYADRDAEIQKAQQEPLEARTKKRGR